MAPTKFSILFLILASFSFPCSSTLDLSDEGDDGCSKLFHEWKEKHGKVYVHGLEEEQKRFHNFKNNLNYVMERKSRKGSTSREEHKVGMNKFADLSNEEFREVYLSKVNNPARKKKKTTTTRTSRLVESCDAPSSVDWRNHGVVTDVKDQGRCGSCWSFSATGAMEGIHAIVTGNLISLSAQELIDCDKTSHGCNGGYMGNAYEWVVSNGGIDSESDYPYIGKNDTCNTKKRNEKVTSIGGYKDVEQNEKSLICAVASQPISVAIVGSAIDFQLYTDGIYEGDCLGNPNYIDHAVLIVGYGSKGDEDYWIVKNSWGIDWGINGYVYIRRNTTKTYGVCAINAAGSYPIMQNSPYPPPVIPPPSSSPPPPPPPPSPSDCGKFSYCLANETCCCMFELFNQCLFYGCCEYENGVCCTRFRTGLDFCCPSDYPVCDLRKGLCLKNEGDYLGVTGKKCGVAKHKFPWTMYENETKINVA